MGGGKPNGLFSGLWFAAAGLVVGQALFALPVLVAQARSIGGVGAWQRGAVALGYVYLAPPLLALLIGSLLGASIVVPGFPDGWPPAARGMLVGVGSLAVWVLMGNGLMQSMAGVSPAGGSEAPPGVAQMAALLLLPGPFVLVTAVGAGAGFLLHAVLPRSSPSSPTGEAYSHGVD